MSVKKKFKKKNIYVFIIMIIFIILLIISVTKIICWYIDNKNINKNSNDIQKKVDLNKIEDNSNTEIIGEDIEKSDPYWDYIKMNMIEVDFKDLKKINKEVKGWIQVNGTNINYPFVQASNNEFYLTHSFDKKYNAAGWVFMDYRNSSKEFDKNTILYAHGRYNKTLFGSLKDILKSKWFSNKNNYVVKLSTEYENTLWQVFSIYHIPTTSDYIQTIFYSDNEYNEFINLIKDRSLHNFNTTITTNDRILTLSTCYNKQEKMVMHAKMIKREKR